MIRGSGIDGSFDEHQADVPRFKILRAATHAGLHSLVAVPSRLGSSVTPQKPLNGMRLSVKDLFHLKAYRQLLVARPSRNAMAHKSTLQSMFED